MGQLNLMDARGRLEDAELDGLLILSPRHFTYATGHTSWFMNLYGEAGYGAAVIPGDPAKAPTALISDVEEPPFRQTAPDFAVRSYPVWIAYVDGPAPGSGADAFSHLSAHSQEQPTQRSGQVDPGAVMDLLVDLVRSLGLDRGRLGYEKGFVSAPVRSRLAAALPDVSLVDATRLLEELRAVKSPAEAELLRRGTELSEAGIRAVINDLRPGMSGNAIAHRYRLAVFEAAAGEGDVTAARITLRVGPHVLEPISSASYAVQPGDLVFLDCGAEVGGYWADMGRCVVCGRATQQQRQIYQALRAGFDAAIAQLRVGRRPAAVFRAGMEAVHAAGMTSYVRGNLGHGVGLARAPELPIISQEEPLMLAPGQVVSVEFPYYIGGIGGFQIEDTFHLGEGETTCFNRLPRELVEVD